MENNHVLCNHAVFSLAAINKHASFVANGRVVLSGSDADTLRLANFDGSLLKIVLENLVRALSNLSFTIELEATSKNVQFIVVRNRCVALTALYQLLGRKRSSLPNYLVSHYSALDDFFNRLLIHATNHVGVKA